MTEVEKMQRAEARARLAPAARVAWDLIGESDEFVKAYDNDPVIRYYVSMGWHARDDEEVIRALLDGLRVLGKANDELKAVLGRQLAVGPVGPTILVLNRPAIEPER